MKLKESNIPELKPVKGSFGFHQLSKMSDMGSIVKISKPVFEKLVSILEKSGTDILMDDESVLYTVFSYGDNYNLVKLKENINESYTGNPGDKLTHKHNKNISIELLSTTNKGWKVKQTEKIGGREKTTIQHYDSQDIKPSGKSLFEISEKQPRKVTSYDAYVLSRLADDVGSGNTEDFLEKHNVDLKLLAKAISQDVIDKYEVRDIIKGTAHKFLIKKFMKNFVKESKKPLKENAEFDLASKLYSKVNGNEIKFYDQLEILQDKLGQPKYMVWLATALKAKGINMQSNPKIKNPQEAEEFLFNLMNK